MGSGDHKPHSKNNEDAVWDRASSSTEGGRRPKTDLLSRGDERLVATELRRGCAFQHDQILQRKLNILNCSGFFFLNEKFHHSPCGGFIAHRDHHEPVLDLNILVPRLFLTFTFLQKSKVGSHQTEKEHSRTFILCHLLCQAPVVRSS